jgi:plasmid stabilization system protein ParE
MKSILDPSFRYTPAAQTDLRETFARVKKEQEEKARMEAEQRLDKVIRMRRGNGSR